MHLIIKVRNASTHFLVAFCSSNWEEGVLIAIALKLVGTLYKLSWHGSKIGNTEKGSKLKTTIKHWQMHSLYTKLVPYPSSSAEHSKS